MFQAMASDAQLPASPPARVAGRAAAQPEPDDLALIRAVARGERWALGALYDRYAGVLHGLAQRMLRDAGEADDLVHDVFMEVHRHAGEYDRSRGSVRTWLCVRARSRALDRLRAPARARRVSFEAEAHEPELRVPTGAHDAPLDDDADRLRAALGALPAAQRTVLELGYFEGLSCSEIALALEVPVGTVKSRARSALERLRAALADA